MPKAEVTHYLLIADCILVAIKQQPLRVYSQHRLIGTIDIHQ
jgi:hypothetical protein